MIKIGTLISVIFVCWSVFFSALAGGLVVKDQSIDLPSLKNPMQYSLYLPDGYCEENLSYPILYLLHGYGGSHRDWLNGGSVVKTLDRLIANGLISPLIVVMPSASKSWYVNSSKHGQFETALLLEFPKLLEANLHSLKVREGRAIAGLSMGGYGALRFAFRSPEKFGSVAALSPAIFPNVVGKDAFKPVQLKLFAGAFDEPFSSDKYNERNVFTLAKTISNPPAIYLTVGDDDWFGLYAGTFSFYQHLKSQKIPVELRVTDGNHNWKLWSREIERVLIFLNEQLSPAIQRSLVFKDMDQDVAVETIINNNKSTLCFR
ncbi:alpha/beta hydrolase [Kiloniella antarctica]|uniref:Alpha/beta hydrolase n=1 Tax=Kiloniella antarctica TaxID=1550907 RepID=A0ABW5BKS3_9PROT